MTTTDTRPRFSTPATGRGSTFTIRLPLQPGPVPALATPRAEIPRCRILVIEDNGDGADMLRTLLELEGHEVQIAYADRARRGGSWLAEV